MKVRVTDITAATQAVPEWRKCYVYTPSAWENSQPLWVKKTSTSDSTVIIDNVWHKKRVILSKH